MNQDKNYLEETTFLFEIQLWNHFHPNVSKWTWIKIVREFYLEIYLVRLLLDTMDVLSCFCPWHWTWHSDLLNGLSGWAVLQWTIVKEEKDCGYRANNFSLGNGPATRSSKNLNVTFNACGKGNWVHLMSHLGAFKNYVDQRGWLGGSPNVNCSNKPYLVKASTRGR